MNSKYIICSLLAVGLIAGSTMVTSAKDKDKSKLEAQAKVSKADAEKSALAKVPGGTIKEGEIEKEDGKLVWSIDITTPDSEDVIEVNVDASTGEVLSVEKESSEDQAKEKEEDDDKDQKGEHKD